jgi:hypothetical protein
VEFWADTKTSVWGKKKKLVAGILWALPSKESRGLSKMSNPPDWVKESRGVITHYLWVGSLREPNNT